MRIFFAACSSQDTRLCYFALRSSYRATEKFEKTTIFLFLFALYHNLPNCQTYTRCRLELFMRTQHKVPVTRHEHWMRGGGAVAGGGDFLRPAPCQESLQLMWHTTLQTDKPAQPAWTCSLGSRDSGDQGFNCIVYGYGEASTFSQKSSFSIESY